MQQGATSDKPNLSVDAWISYLNGKSSENKQFAESLEVSKVVEDEKEVNGRRNSTKLSSMPERPHSRLKSAISRKMSQEAQMALLDMGLATDETASNAGGAANGTSLEKSGNQESHLLQVNGALQNSFAATSQERLSSAFEEELPIANSVTDNQDLSFSLKTESESKPKFEASMTSHKGDTPRMDGRPLLSDRDRIYNPLEASYRSELRKITSRMGVELDAIHAIHCNHHKKSSKQAMTSSNKSQSKSKSHSTFNFTNHELYANLPSCAKCRQRYFSSCLQNSKHGTVKPMISPDPGIKNLNQQRNVLAFNTSAPRKSFIDINGVANANSDRSSPMRPKSVSPMRHLASKNRQTSGSHNITRESRNIDKSFSRANGNRMNSATPIPTKLVEPLSHSGVHTQIPNSKFHDSKNRTIVIPKLPLANVTNSPKNKRRNSASQGNDAKQQQNGNAAKRSNPQNSQKLEKTSAKLKEIERLKTKTDVDKSGSNSKTEHKNRVQSGFYDSRFEGEWQRPWNPEDTKSATSSKEEEEPIDESQRQIREQSITKCKEWLALWFSNQS